MDNITHTLTGLMLSRAGLNRLSPRAAAILMLAANAPDIDVVSAASGAVDYLQYHRGLTHSLMAIPFLAVLPVLVVRLFARQKIGWMGAYTVSLAGVVSHIALDWTNMYGVRLLSPFSDRWFNADITAVVDVWLWVALLLGLVGPFLSRLVSSEIGARPGSGSGMAVFVLCFCCCYSAGRYVLHERAVAVLDSRLYEGQAPARVAAIPTPANPFRWVGLVAGGGFFEVYPDLNLLAEFDPTAGRIFYQPESVPAIGRARSTEAFRIFLDFSQWPLWQTTSVAEPENGSLVQAMDLRFGIPPESRFVASALLDGGLHVVKSGFEFGVRLRK